MVTDRDLLVLVAQTQRIEAALDRLTAATKQLTDVIADMIGVLSDADPS